MVVVKIDFHFQIALLSVASALKWVTEMSDRRDLLQCANRLPVYKWLSTVVGKDTEYCTVLNKMLCVPPHSVYLSCPMHSFPVLGWSFVMRTVCATHILGSAVEGNGSIVTISLRNKSSAIH